METTTKKLIEQAFGLRLNKNKSRDLTRLVFEIQRREDLSAREIIQRLITGLDLKNHSPEAKFLAIRKALIAARFPLSSLTGPIDPANVYLTELKEPLPDNYRVSETFIPEKILVETSVNNTPIRKRIEELFPAVELEEIDYYSNYLKKHPFVVSDLKRPILFLTREKWDFIKPCPCTKHHMRCGYWIFNLGFGCPFDCSYCFLEQYTNFPGIILPANIDDFFEKFDNFHHNLKSTIRIGTGEFCDSLALDHITGYSSQLIPYFAKKEKVLFELKTKSANVENILNCEPARNIIISWSVNPPAVSAGEELGAPNLEKRLDAARAVQKKGFSIAFHFDPIIHYEGWEKDYAAVIEKIYDTVKAPFAWISLGTLRSNRQLKSVCEQRFPESTIFYGELLLGEDKKLRYPRELREKIYREVLARIRKQDATTPVYLCMENKETWNCIGDFSSTSQIERYIIGSEN